MVVGRMMRASSARVTGERVAGNSTCDSLRLVDREGMKGAKMGKLVTKNKWCFSHKLLAIVVCLLWALHVGAASGFSMFSDSGSTLNLTAAGFAWVSTMDGSDLKDGAEGNGETHGKSHEVADAEVETAFTSIDSMLQWAIGHSDPDKLKSTAQEVQGMTAQQLEQRQLELKELMEKLRMKSDADLMKISLADLQNNSSPAADRHRALQELLQLVEPIDNAIDVADLNKLGGLVVVIGELDRAEGELRTTAAWVLGKASQNNPVVQNQLLRLGALPKLMKMVASSDKEEAVKALYAVSALIRNFPSGQEAFYRDGGAVLLQVLLSGEHVDARLQKKALYLLAELAEQQVEMEGQVSNGVDDKLLVSIVRLAEANDLDTQEKALMALRSLIGLNSTVCERLQTVCQADAALERLRVRYQMLILNPELEDYIKDLEVLREEVAETLSSQSQESISSQDEEKHDVDRLL